MGLCSTVQQTHPRIALKTRRNHFSDNTDPFSDRSWRSNKYRGVCTDKPIGTAHSAIQRFLTYRYNIVNAVFNPTKCLLGDDPSAIDNLAEGERDWL
jgi:hypothetical protein